MSSSQWIMTFLCGGLGAGLVWALMPTHNGLRPTPPYEKAELTVPDDSEVLRQLAAMRRELDDVRRDAAEVAIERASKADSDEPPPRRPRGPVDDNGDPLTGEELASALVQERQDHRDQLDLVIAGTEQDSTRAAELERDITNTIGQHAPETASIADLACGASLCRVVFEHESPENRSAFADGIAGQPGFRQAGMAHLEHREDGALLTYIYLSASGDHF